MDLETRIAAINRRLEEVGSVFRTDDGLTIVGYFGQLAFLRKSFDSVDALEATVKNLKPRRV